jgi:hypothetical protein
MAVYSIILKRTQLITNFLLVISNKWLRLFTQWASTKEVSTLLLQVIRGYHLANSIYHQ